MTVAPSGERLLGLVLFHISVTMLSPVMQYDETATEQVTDCSYQARARPRSAPV